jgi:hypothetical protein
MVWFRLAGWQLVAGAGFACGFLFFERPYFGALFKLAVRDPRAVYSCTPGTLVCESDMCASHEDRASLAGGQLMMLLTC